MRAYISVSYQLRNALREELDAIKVALTSHQIEPFLFVDQYQFDPLDEMAMMKQALADIDSCGMLIAETSDKAIGIGIETGYAKARNKPVIYLRKKTAPHSTTLSGISDYRVYYENAADLKMQLESVLKQLL